MTARETLTYDICAPSSSLLHLAEHCHIHKDPYLELLERHRR
jgi:hypothetical protein